MKRDTITAAACVLLVAMFIACGGAGVVTTPSTSTVSSSPSSAPAPTSESVPSTATEGVAASRESDSRTASLYKITAEEYAGIRLGMSYDEVVGVFGSHGVELAASSGFTMRQWVNDGFLAGGSNAIISFENGRVSMRAQSGLPSVPGSEALEQGEIESDAQQEERRARELAIAVAKQQEAERQRKLLVMADEAIANEARFREFQDSSGSFRVRARFTGLDGDKVTLRRADNDKIITIQLEKLSQADQEWIAEKRKSAGK